MFLQTEVPAPVVETPVAKSLSIMDLIVNVGVAGSVILGIFFVLLFVDLYLYFERYFAIKAASKITDKFMN